MRKLLTYALAALHFVSTRKEQPIPVQVNMPPLPDYMIW